MIQFVLNMWKVKFLLVLGLTWIITFATEAKDKVEAISFNYELTREDCPVPRDNNYVIFKVYSYGKKALLTAEAGKRNATHGILFKGLAATDRQGRIPALMGTTPYDAHKEYFDRFFSGTEFLQFVQETNKGFHEEIKVSGKEYKVGIIVKVNINSLRKHLEADGVLTNVFDMMIQ